MTTPGMVWSGHWAQIARPVRYLLVGGLNTLVGYALFALCYFALAEAVSYAVILVLAHALAVTASFTTHRAWVFGRSGSSGLANLVRAWARFQLSYLGLLATGLVVNAAMLVWVTRSVWLAQAVAMAINVGLGWILHRHVVFKSSVNGDLRLETRPRQ